jgi:hypothetical protein
MIGYSEDYYGWTLEQADLLLKAQFSKLDIPNLIIEITSMGRNEKREAENRLAGKRRLNFATLITKERLNFPAANHSHVDSITDVSFMTGKLSAQSWHTVKAVFHRANRARHGKLKINRVITALRLSGMLGFLPWRVTWLN